MYFSWRAEPYFSYVAVTILSTQANIYRHPLQHVSTVSPLNTLLKVLVCAAQSSFCCHLEGTHTTWLHPEGLQRHVVLLAEHLYEEHWSGATEVEQDLGGKTMGRTSRARAGVIWVDSGLV